MFQCGRIEFSGRAAAGLYARHRDYESVRGIESFEPWLERLETKITEAVLEQCASEFPPVWFELETGKLEQLLERLLRRRKLVRELIVAAWKSTAQPFPNWK